MLDVTPVILCGGAGTRLWPLSRVGFPKQFLSLAGSESLFQQAVNRLAKLNGPTFKVNPPIVVTGEDHRFIALEQMREIKIDLECALLEPFSKNTAPALTLAALEAIKNGEDPVLVVTPADQTVSDDEAFLSAIAKAAKEAESSAVVILGVKPDRPATGFGYIRCQERNENKPNEAEVVCEFVEKPDLETAKKYFHSGSFYWNAGIFILKASVWIKMLKDFHPSILDSTQKSWINRTTDGKFIRPNRVDFENVPSESIDYAAMEHCAGSHFLTKMVKLDAGWNDLGAWDAVWEASTKDAHGNSLFGDVISISSRDSLVHATSRLVSVVGLENVIVVETPDAVLVAEKSKSQDVKEIVARLKENKREESTLHRKVHRPWGWYDSIDEDDRFKVKRIQVKPKASLSLQKHFHRAEHWIVVKGTAEISKGSQKLILTENQSTYIPLGEVHRLANPGAIPLEIIEIQSGSYLGEDDIERLDDSYGRDVKKF